MIEKIQDYVISRYGFENKITIFVFKITEKFSK